MKTKKRPCERFPKGFALYDLRQEAKIRLAEGGDEILVQFVAALIAHGTTYFEDVFEAVRDLAGDERLEQRVSDLLAREEGLLWEVYRGRGLGPSYRLL